MTPSQKKQKKLPKRIYLHREGSAPDEYLQADEKIGGIDHGTVIGIYELVEVKTMNITEELI